MLLLFKLLFFYSSGPRTLGAFRPLWYCSWTKSIRKLNCVKTSFWKTYATRTSPKPFRMKTGNAEAVRFSGKSKNPFWALKIFSYFGEIEISSHFLSKKIEENPPGNIAGKSEKNIQNKENKIFSKRTNIGPFRSQNPSKRSVKKVQKRSEKDFFLTWILLRKAPMLVHWPFGQKWNSSKFQPISKFDTYSGRA